jgi:glycosyltransferase involved in cell wall biosynthesis
MINVLHLRDTDRICGPGKTIIETACATDRRAFSQKVGLFEVAGESPSIYRQAAEARGVEVIPVRSAHPYDPRLVTTLLDIVKRHDIHIVHSHEYKSDLLTWALRRLHRVPIMTTIHGWITNSRKSRLMVGLSQKVLGGFDRVVAVSDGTRRRVLACGVPADRVVVIHNAIVTDNYRPEDHAPGFLRERFRLPGGAVVVGSIGRLSPEKGQYDMLEAIRRVAPVRPHVYFAFVGDGPDRAGLEQRAREYGVADRVLFTGHLHDVRPVYRDLDLLALTSHTEGFPNVVLEALCMETPVLATDVGGTGEIVHDEVTGVLIPAKQPDRIERGLLRLLDDPAGAERLMRAGRQTVFARFSFRERVAREEALYREILTGSAPASSRRRDGRP